MNEPYLTKAYILMGNDILLSEGAVPTFTGISSLNPAESLKASLKEKHDIIVDRVRALSQVERVEVLSVPGEEREGWPQGVRTIPVWSFLVLPGETCSPKGLTRVNLKVAAETIDMPDLP